jgi:hypothetical protein
MSHIDHQGISLPTTDGVTEVGGIHVAAMRPAIGRHQAKTPRRALLCVIEKHNELRRLHDLPRSTCPWDPQRFAVEFWIVPNFVCSELLYFCQQLGLVRRRIGIHHVLQLFGESGIEFGLCTALFGRSVNIEVTGGILMGAYRKLRGLPGTI